MSLVPIYVCEEGSELPDDGTYFVVAANGMFMHKDVGTVKALVRFDLDKVPLLRDFEPPKPKSVPVYIFDNECGDLPDNEDYFVIAKNGVHRHTQSSTYKEFIKANFGDIPNLGTLQTKVRFELPHIPVNIMWRCLLFFRRVWYVHKAEAAVILFYNAKTQDYFLHAPRQQVSGGGVDYGTLPGKIPDPAEARFVIEMRQKGYVRVGTIHSHCNFNAYHSPVDTGDEAEWPDGVHITIGHVDSKYFSLMSSLVVNNNRFQVDPSTIIQGLKEKRSRKIGFGQGDNFFDVTLSTDERDAVVGLHQQEIEEEWMPKVQPRTYGGGNWYANTAWGQHKLNQQREEERDTHVSACVPATPPATPVVPDGVTPLEEMTPPPEQTTLSGDLADVVEAMNQVQVGVSENPVTSVTMPVATNAEVPLVMPEEVIGEPAGDAHEGMFLRRVRSHGMALRTHGETIPAERKAKLLATLQAFFRKTTITDEDILQAARVNAKYPSYYEKKGYAVQCQNQS